MNDLSKIVAQLEEQRDAIDRALKALREIGGSSGAVRVAATSAAASVAPAGKKKGPGRPRKRRLSEEGRQRIIEAAKRRWAKVNATKKAK